MRWQVYSGDLLHLMDKGIRHVEQGSVVLMPPCGSPYLAVLHAVAVDGAYHSTPANVTAVLTDSLRMAAGLGARTVAMTAVATGYGRMSVREFARGLYDIVGTSIPPVEQVTIGFRTLNEAAELLAVIPKIESAMPRT